MSHSGDGEGASLPLRDCVSYKLVKLPGIASVTYGAVAEDRGKGPVTEGVPALQAKDIVDGVLVRRSSLLIEEQEHATKRRSWLDFGDLVIVLAGKVGNSALVGEDQAGWNAVRSVGIVKFTAEGIKEEVNVWLHQWLRTPDAREWFALHAAGSAHTTLSVSDLKELPVPLPPLDYRRHVLREIGVVEKRRLLNKRIVVTAIELADAYFTQAIQDYTDAPRRPIAEVAKVVNGGGFQSKTTSGEEISAALVAPAEVLRSSSPYLDSTARTARAAESKVCASGSLLMAPKPGQVKAVMARIPVLPGRGTAALCPEEDSDGLWLLHELRSRSRDLRAIMQGEQAREISVKGLRRLEVSWPADEVRRGFAQKASLLHERAYTALKENRLLEDVIATNLIARIPGRVPGTENDI